MSMIRESGGGNGKKSNVFAIAAVLILRFQPCLASIFGWGMHAQLWLLPSCGQRLPSMSGAGTIFSNLT